MKDFPAGFVTAYFERLEAAGGLRSETVWLLFIARRKGYRLADQGYFENLRAALRTAAVRARIAELAGQDPAMTAPGTRSDTGTSDDPFRYAAQAAVHSAVHHSVHAAVSAAATTSHHSGGSSSGGDSPPSHHHH